MKNSLEKLMSRVGLALLCLLLAVTVVRLPFLPEKIPTHFNFAGQADAYGGKWAALLLPVIAIFLFVMLEVCAFRRPDLLNIPVKIKPEYKTESYAVARLMTQILNVEIMGLCLLIQCAVVFGRPGLLGGVWLLAAVMLATIAVGCVKIWKINR